MIGDPSRLGVRARAALADGENELFLGIGSCWEMAIKHAAARLTLPAPFTPFMERELAANRISLLPISIAHLGRLNALPKHPRGHKDPFDRLLVAQALAEQTALVSNDELLDG